MKNKKTAYYVKNNIMIFIIGIILFCGIGVYASVTFASSTVTYSNTSSGLNSTNVQEAIDELYNSCNNSSTSSGPANDLLDKVDVVESGDGLYKDEYENGRYFYKGANPNNYITFNGEKAGWRIISVESDGTIKITKTASVGTQMYDVQGRYDWFYPTWLNKYLNLEYYDGLTATAKAQIGSHKWGAGAINPNNDLKTQISSENGTRWYGKIALPTVSEYLRANSNKSKCNSFTLYNDNLSTCKKTNWMYINDEWFTFTTNQSGWVIVLVETGSLANTDADEYNQIYHATLYLSSEVKITGGTGNKADPFTIQ